MLLAGELDARGLSRAAREIRSRISTSDLVVELLRLGQSAAAEEVASQWRRDLPAAPDAPLLESVALFAQGSFELAQRRLADVQGGYRRDLVAILTDLATFSVGSTKPPNAQTNPWNIAFVSETGEYAVGKIASNEAQKIPDYAPRGLVQLLDLLPTQGPLWGMLAEFLNAQGNVAAARTAFERARSLGHTPRLLIDHARILKDHEDARRRKADEALGSPVPSADPSPPAGGWEAIGSRPRVLWVIIIGGILSSLVMVLQIRQWLGRFRQRNSA
jgi:tetratricopeptide (TPR) repeat protein